MTAPFVMCAARRTFTKDDSLESSFCIRCVPAGFRTNPERKA